MRNTSSREISRSEGDVFPSASLLLAVYGYITLTACFICFAFYRISSHYKFCIELKQPCTVHRGDGSPIVALGGFCFVSIALYYGVYQYTLQYIVYCVTFKGPTLTPYYNSKCNTELMMCNAELKCDTEVASLGIVHNTESDYYTFKCNTESM